MTHSPTESATEVFVEQPLASPGSPKKNYVPYPTIFSCLQKCLLDQESSLKSNVLGKPEIFALS